MICVPIAAPDTAEAIARMALAATLADCVELRIDRMPGVALAELLASRPCPAIVTNRPLAEGGGFAGTETDRVARLLEAVRLGADYIDVEAATAPALKDSLRLALAGGPTRLIVSWHDFAGTPPAAFLRAKLDAIVADGPAIAKIVTRAESAADGLRVLALIPLAQALGQPIAAFCMGEAGKTSRVMAEHLGSAISYAALDAGAASAPGQLTARQMRAIRRIMEGAADE